MGFNPYNFDSIEELEDFIDENEYEMRLNQEPIELADAKRTLREWKKEARLLKKAKSKELPTFMRL